MDITSFGPWVLLTVGALTLVGAGYRATFGEMERKHWGAWIFGFAIAGVGVYGPAFLEPYGKWLDVVHAMAEDPSEEKYRDFIDEVAGGDVPPRIQAIGMDVMLRRPVPEMERMLERGEAAARTPQARVNLRMTKEAFEEKKRTAELLDRSLAGQTVAVEELERVDPTTRRLLSDRLHRLPTHELERRGLSEAELRGLDRPTPLPLHR